jgi:uncharacterized protein
MSASAVAMLVGMVIVVAYIVACVTVGHLFTTPRRVAPPAPPRESASDIERVEFPARVDATPLAAWYLRAPAAKSAVIFVHGRDGCRGDELRSDTFRLAKRMVAHGMSVVMLDLRGHGESGKSRITFGKRESRDVLGAVDFLLARGYLPKRIGVLGASMGGASAIVATADEPAIGALVTDSSFACLHELLRVKFTMLTRLPNYCLSGALLAARILTGEDIVRQSPVECMKRVRGRAAMVIHSSDDPFVPVAHAHQLAAAGHARKWITSGARHLSSFRTVGQEYDDVVGLFFAQHLRAVSIVPTSAKPNAMSSLSIASGRLRGGAARGASVPKRVGFGDAVTSHAARVASADMRVQRML